MNSYKNMFTLFLVLCLSAKELVSASKWEIQMIQDFLMATGDKKSFTVNIYNCWEKEQKYNFSKKLFEENLISSIGEVENDFLVRNDYPYFRRTFVLDLDCTNFHKILLKANEEKLFSNTNAWLLISQKPYRFQALKNSFLQYDFFADTNIVLAEKKNYKDDEYFYKEIYKISVQSTKIIENKIAIWNKNTGLVHLKNTVANTVMADRRRNLNKMQLGACIVVLNNDTLNHLEDYRDKHIDAITKVNFIFTKHLIEYVNASLLLNSVNTWGYFDKTTNLFTGMIGSLQRNESEIGGTGLFMTKDRVSIIDYIAMTTPTKIRFVFRQPPLSYEQNIFTLPFTTSLWMSAFVLIVLAILLLYLAVWWENKHLKDTTSQTQSDKSLLLDMVMLTLGAVAQQGAPLEPRNVSGKIIMLFTFIAFMFLYVSYSANIVALLQSSATNIRSLENLLESRLKLGSDDTVYNRYYMSTATDATRKAIYDTKISSPPGEPSHFMPLEEGVKRMRKGFYAFHMELGRGYKLVADTFLENEKCGLQEINFLQIVDTYFSIKKNSTFKEMLNLGLRKLRESGIQARELSKIYTKKPECHTAGGNFLSVGLVDSYPAFLFLSAGIFISFALFLLELFAQKKPVFCR